MLPLTPLIRCALYVSPVIFSISSSVITTLPSTVTFLTLKAGRNATRKAIVITRITTAVITIDLRCSCMLSAMVFSSATSCVFSREIPDASGCPDMYFSRESPDSFNFSIQFCLTEFLLSSEILLSFEAFLSFKFFLSFEAFFSFKIFLSSEVFLSSESPISSDGTNLPEVPESTRASATPAESSLDVPSKEFTPNKLSNSLSSITSAPKHLLSHLLFYRLYQVPQACRHSDGYQAFWLCQQEVQAGPA